MLVYVVIIQINKPVTNDVTYAKTFGSVSNTKLINKLSIYTQNYLLNHHRMALQIMKNDSCVIYCTFSFTKT